MENTHFYIYVITMLPLALFLTFQSETEHKFATFVIVYWLLAGPTLNTELFIINIEAWYFDIQPARFIFIIFTVYLIILWGTHRRKRVRENASDNEEIPSAVGNPAFEKFLYIFLALYLLANIIHIRDVLTMREIAASYTNLLVFPVIYLVLKKTADSGMIKTFIKALLIVCVISSIIGIYQFSVDQYFMRIGSSYQAFGNLIRSNGIYRVDFLQGSFLLIGVVVVLITIRRRIWKMVLILLFLVGIVFTFHRTTWFITIVVFVVYLIKGKELKFWQLTATSIFLVIFSYFFLQVNPSLLKPVEDSLFIRERLGMDTWTDRLMLYNMALRRIPSCFFVGVGGVKSEIYLQDVLRAGGTIEVALGERGGIHNLYLLTAFIYGVPVALFFTIFCISCFAFFWRKINQKRKFYFIALSIILTYMLQNLLNMFYLYHDFGILMAIFLGISIAIHLRNSGLDSLMVSKADGR